MPSIIPATTIRIEPEEKRGIRYPRRTRPLHVHCRQRMPQGALPRRRDAIRDEGRAKEERGVAWMPQIEKEKTDRGLAYMEAIAGRWF